MIIVPIKENETIDRALKKFKKKFEKTGIVRQLRERQAFEKPSITRRSTVKRAIYKNTLRMQEESWLLLYFLTYYRFPFFCRNFV